MFKGLFTLLLIHSCLWGGTAWAAEIKNSQITPSSTLPSSPQFTLQQIADGITDDVYIKADGTRSHNGYVAPGQQQGTIRLTLNRSYDLSAFNLWNDINVRREGIKTFTLTFHDDGAQELITHGPFETEIGEEDIQVFNFQTVQNVKHVDLDIISVFRDAGISQIEVREVSFEGEPYIANRGGGSSSSGDGISTGGGLTVHVNGGDVVNLIGALFGGGNKSDKDANKEPHEDKYVEDRPQANQSPVARDDAVNRVDSVNTPTTFNPLTNDSDPDGHELSVTSISNIHPGLTAELLPDGQISLFANFVSTPLSLTYTITDIQGASDSATVTYQVFRVDEPVPNKPPIANDDAIEIVSARSGPTRFNPLTNDNDPDGHEFSVTSISNIQPGLTAELLPDGKISLSTARINTPLSLTYTITDIQGGTDSAQITYQVLQAVDPLVNIPPVAVDDVLTIKTGITQTVSPLLNDTDADAHTLSITSLVDVSPFLVARLLDDQTIRITAPSDQSGVYDLSYIVSDGHAGTVRGRISVNVEVPDTVNRPPIARSDLIDLNLKTLNQFSVLKNDYDPDGDEVFLVEVNGESVDRAANAATIKAAANYVSKASNGEETQFTYKISDGKDGIATGQINVRAKIKTNRPPVGRDQSFSVSGVSATGNFLNYATDPDNDNLSIEQVISSPQIVFNYNPDGAFDTTFPENGTYSFVIRVSDGKGESDEYSLTYNVTGVTEQPVNQPPIPTADNLVLKAGESLIFSPLSNDSDPENEDLTITDIQTSSGVNAEIMPDGQLKINLPKSQPSETISYTVKDEFGHSAQGVIGIKTAAPEMPKAPIWPLIVGAAGLVGGGLAYAASRRPPPPSQPTPSQAAHQTPRRTQLPGRNGQGWFPPTPPRRDDDDGKPPRPPEAGIVFANSPLLAGAVAAGPAPLAPLGKMVPSGLQSLTGQFAVLKPAYRATGRIGGPQEGIPTNDDVSFGTGFLITPNHIMTNQHVYEFYKHYLTGPDCGGIEFMAERDRDASDYVPFDGQPPLIIPDLDIAIFTLSRPVTDRTPIDRVAIPTDELDAREVVSISYPCPFEVDELILSVVEKDPVFAVKRLSQGRVFRHSTDTDTPYGVIASVDSRINSTKSLSAICHNASTLGGSSGAPILDLDGKLVGVHFAGDRAFNGQEAANLAMAIEMLADVGPNKIMDQTKNNDIA